MLTQKQKIAIRRHLGVPFSGTAEAGRLFGWRFTWYREDLEYRMNNMQVNEESLITGKSTASAQIMGRPTVGDILTYTVEDSTVGALQGSYEVQSSDFNLPANTVNPSEASPLYAIALNSAIALKPILEPAGYAVAGVMPSDLFSPAYLPPYYAEVLVLGKGSAVFELTTSLSPGATTNLRVEDPGSPCTVRASLPDPVTGAPSALYGYVDLLDVLAMNMTAAQMSLMFTQTEKVLWRQNEISARQKLYRTYIYQLEAAIGGKDYIEQFGRSSSGAATA